MQWEAVMRCPLSPALGATEGQFPHFLDAREKHQLSVKADGTGPGSTSLG